MLAYKFLLPGARGPFSGYAWPVPAATGPGPWVAASDGAVACRTAVHGCLVEHLPWWIQEELWLAEFATPVTFVGHKLMARRARLVRRVDGWGPGTARELAAACAGRAGDPQAEGLGAATAAYVAAHAALRAGGEAAMAAERSWQADWLREHLALRDGTRRTG
jgi:hypothetical protein